MGRDLSMGKAVFEFGVPLRPKRERGCRKITAATFPKMILMETDGLFGALPFTPGSLLNNFCKTNLYTGLIRQSQLIMDVISVDSSHEFS